MEDAVKRDRGRALEHWACIVSSILLALGGVALVALWDIVERIWLRLQYRGRHVAYRLQSEHVGDAFVVHVCLPRGYDPARTYPLIVVLDGDSDALPMAGAALQEHVEAIVAGIGYGSDEDDARERDYTPFVAPEIDWAPSGGGAAFQSFLVEELLPDLEAQYCILGAEHRILAGHSLAGLATVYALLRSPADSPVFGGYLAASPTLPLAERAIFGIEEALASERTDLPGFLFLSVGGLESAEMRQATVDLAALLRERAYPSLVVHTVIRQGRGHGGNNWQSYIDGVRLMRERGIL